MFVLLGGIALGGEPPEQVAWNDTPKTFSGMYVKVGLKSGGKIEGQWVSVTPDSFTMRNAKRKRIETIPRSSLARIRAGERHARGRVIGVIAGLYLGGLVVQKTTSPKGALAAVSGGLSLGYLLGHSYDHAAREYEILPERVE